MIIVQHGEKERLPGDPGLTAAGRSQAARTAAYLAGLDGPVSSVYASPLRRAQETANPIASALGLSLRTDERLRERMNWEGEAVQSLEDFLADWDRASRERDFVPVSGESSRLAGRRLLGFLDELPDTPTVVVVAHGGLTTDLLREVLGDHNLRARRSDLIVDGVPCCGLTTLRREDRAWSVVSIADTAHLKPVD